MEEYLQAGKLKIATKAELKKFDVHAYWVGMQMVFSTLAAIYFDLCSIPSMSVEPERVFSGFTLLQHFLTYRSKFSITALRNRLKVDAVEAMKCLHGWRKSGLISLMRKQVETWKKEIQWLIRRSDKVA